MPRMLTTAESKVLAAFRVQGSLTDDLLGHFADLPRTAAVEARRRLRGLGVIKRGRVRNVGHGRNLVAWEVNNG